ncbi:MAG: hypothetical protein QW491_09555 [Thermoproteota archaeon]
MTRKYEKRTIPLDVDPEEARREAISILRRKIAEIAEESENPELTPEQRMKAMNALAYLVSTLNALLKEMPEKEREEGEEDLAKLLEKTPLLAVKEEDIGSLSFKALLESFRLIVSILEDEGLTLDVKRRWVETLPGLIQALLNYAQTGSGVEPVDRGELV